MLHTLRHTDTSPSAKRFGGKEGATGEGWGWVGWRLGRRRSERTGTWKMNVAFANTLPQSFPNPFIHPSLKSRGKGKLKGVLR